MNTTIKERNSNIAAITVFTCSSITDNSWYYNDHVTNARLQGNQRSLTRSMDAYMQQPYYSASD
jgi:hypothetical protein